MMEVVVTTGLQSSNQIITTNKPTSSFFPTGQMPFLSPNQLGK